jgi:hypothetical protein
MLLDGKAKESGEAWMLKQVMVLGSSGYDTTRNYALTEDSYMLNTRKTFCQPEWYSSALSPYLGASVAVAYTNDGDLRDAYR